MLNQRHVAGLGNIYVDEVLWMSGINPEQPANTLTDKQIQVLHDNIIQELSRAIEYKGTTVHTVSYTHLDVYKRQVPVYYYGTNEKDDFRAENIQRTPAGSTYDAYFKDQKLGTVSYTHLDVYKRQVV